MNKLGEYSAKWKLNISSKKTKIMVFSKLNKQPEYSHNIGKVTDKCVPGLSVSRINYDTN